MNETAQQLEQPMVAEADLPKEPLPKSQYNGVSYARKVDKWVCKALLNTDESGKRRLKHIGYFSNDRDAAIARNHYIDENNLKCRKSKIEEA